MIENRRLWTREEINRLAPDFAMWLRDGAQVSAIEEALLLAREDLEALKTIRKAMGYIQNGSQTTVTFAQDDATGTFIMRSGRTMVVYEDGFENLFKAFQEKYAKELEQD